MKTTQTSVNYVEWLNPEEMHKSSLSWLSELNFIKDEHLFFEHLVQTFTIELLEFQDFSSDKELVNTINRSQRHNDTLIKSLIDHEKKLKIMVDGIDQPKDEKIYKETHRELIVEIHQFLEGYKMLKTQLFDLIKNIKKEEKQRSLFDKNH